MLGRPWRQPITLTMPPGDEEILDTDVRLGWTEVNLTLNLPLHRTEEILLFVPGTKMCPTDRDALGMPRLYPERRGGNTFHFYQNVFRETEIVLWLKKSYPDLYAAWYTQRPEAFA